MKFQIVKQYIPPKHFFNKMIKDFCETKSKFREKFDFANNMAHNITQIL